MRLNFAWDSALVSSRVTFEVRRPLIHHSSLVCHGDLQIASPIEQPSVMQAAVPRQHLVKGTETKPKPHTAGSKNAHLVLEMLFLIFDKK